MKKKRQKLQLSKKKSLLIICSILAIGIFILAVSILFTPTKIENTVSNEAEQTESSKLRESTEPTNDIQSDSKTINNGVQPTEPNTQINDNNSNKSLEKSDTTQSEGEQLPIIKANLIFVFDDAGNNLSDLQYFLDLPFPVTISVMPQRTYSVESANKIRASGKEVFLHQPMQAINQSIDPGKGAILPTMDGKEITQQLLANISQIAPIKGMNNHEGSLITSDRYRMGVVLDVCIDEDIIFLDSLTNVDSIVAYSAMDRDLDILLRDIFIDNSTVREDMKTMIEKGLAVADKQGYAIMIGHVFNPELASLLNDMYPELKMQGYKFITASQLYEQLY
ncbi:MAG: hypothetical protein BKP49_00290 [Treponema sp. CETP13]|nr:MAG: hypothetical protein BKP49_00290 [Treponema sp. CETP13]